MKNMLALAISVAAGAHVKQTDKGGNAYILHPLRMMMRLRTSDEELMSIAVLHDTVEDSDVTIDSLWELGFSKRVLDAVECLTKKNGENYDDFIVRCATNLDATIVKLEDLRDNSDITRLKGLSDKDTARLAKYNRAYTFLTGVLESRRNAGYLVADCLA